MEKLIKERKSGWEKLEEEQKNKIFSFADTYIQFLNQAKTEREATKQILLELREAGFQDIMQKENLKKGDKVYYNNRGKSVYAAVVGDFSQVMGCNIVGAHLDSPRIDLKPNPLYEDIHLALLKTHYYGGIKKYQWTAIPLAIHGVFVKTNGEKIEVKIGEDPTDPIFTITDLLPHLAQQQVNKKLDDAIMGESLNILVGSIPCDACEKEAIKEHILSILNEKYGITESDFSSAELEVVPSFAARDLGFDRSMVAAYGQDDRVCCYTLLQAIKNAQTSSYTQVALFSDKEEIGSMGNTGMSSSTFDYFMEQILEKSGYSEPGLLGKVFCQSRMLSADVGAGMDPNYQEVSEKNNSSYIGFGVELNKYTGSRGKAGSSDANAEFVAFVRGIFEKKGIQYQVSELGKVDIGGGGTIAFILADKGVDVIDCGVPVISMHSPYEVTSKYDIYSAYLAYLAFLEVEEKVRY